jgi:anti-sigma B factor antagonist
LVAVVTSRIEQDRVVVAPDGEVDVYTVTHLRAALVECLDAGRVHIVVDLAAVTFMDSSGLGVLLGALKRVRADGGSMCLVGPTTTMHRVLRSTGLTKVFAVYDSLDELLADGQPNRTIRGSTGDGPATR